GVVINQLGKRGTNEWYFGVQTVCEPDSLSSSRGDGWFPNATLPTGYKYDTPDQPGTLYRAGKDNKQTRTVYSAYAGGPLIEDRLFIFVAGESEKVDGVSTNASSDSIQARNNYEYSTPKFYGKLDWNINDSNIVEYTRIQNTDRRSGYYTSFDYDGLVGGDRTGTYPDTYKIKDTYDIFKYTGYIT
ncbi:Oar protein, partial [Xanthomonas sp. LMG 8992]|nr:Oar protein [Xanthomonas sp. LMG 8992]